MEVCICMRGINVIFKYILNGDNSHNANLWISLFVMNKNTFTLLLSVLASDDLFLFLNVS